MLSSKLRPAAAVSGLTRAFESSKLCSRCSPFPLTTAILQQKQQKARIGSTNNPKWRPVSILDDWVAKEARPISLRQLMVFGRSLTESRLISSANYVRTELPTRLAHRIRDIQQLPYVVVSNPHINTVYDLYYDAFDTFRKVREVKTLEDNDVLCEMIRKMLREHLAVIPKLAMGILECGGLMRADELDKFMNTILRSRISRRVIAEQHLSLTDTFSAPWFSPGLRLAESEFIGEVFLKCVARDVIAGCGRAVQDLARAAYGADVPLPEIRLLGHLDATFPYILSHLEYIIGELLRNSVQAVIEKHQRDGKGGTPPPIEVTICEAQQHVIIRVSDQGGGIPADMMPYLWSFSKGPHSRRIIENLEQVPRMSATLQELRTTTSSSPPPPSSPCTSATTTQPPSSTSTAPEATTTISPTAPLTTPSAAAAAASENHPLSSLSSLATRPPHLKLGMGLPLSRVYAEYWAGKLNLHSLEGYGVDAFLQISKLGNKNEQLTTRASMDAV